MRTGYIYIHTSVSGLSYIGKSLAPYGKRWQDHVNAAYDEKYKEFNYPLQRAIRKYGAETFTTDTLEDGVPEELLSELEVMYIEKFNTFYNGYNQTKGGEGAQGERSIEAKQRIAAANTERVWTDEMRQKMANSKTGTVLKPWFIVTPDGVRTNIYDTDKATYALQNSWHVGSFKNLFSKARGVGSTITTGFFIGYTVGNIGDTYE